MRFTICISGTPASPSCLTSRPPHGAPGTTDSMGRRRVCPPFETGWLRMVRFLDFVGHGYPWNSMDTRESSLSAVAFHRSLSCSWAKQLVRQIIGVDVTHSFYSVQYFCVTTAILHRMFTAVAAMYKAGNPQATPKPLLGWGLLIGWTRSPSCRGGGKVGKVENYIYDHIRELI